MKEIKKFLNITIFISFETIDRNSKFHIKLYNSAVCMNAYETLR